MMGPKLGGQPKTLFAPAKAEKLALEAKAGDPDWSYIVHHDPKGTGGSFIEIQDEDGETVGHF